jgi:hypothetical protein
MVELENMFPIPWDGWTGKYVSHALGWLNWKICFPPTTTGQEGYGCAVHPQVTVLAVRKNYNGIDLFSALLQIYSYSGNLSLNC